MCADLDGLDDSLELICRVAARSVSVPRDALRVGSHINIDAEHAYFKMIRTRWSESLRHAFHELRIRSGCGEARE